MPETEMNLSDTFYVALCMTVLILGVVYWFWTQNQYIQRKLNLLENIVYEMKSSMNSIPAPLTPAQEVESDLKPAVYPPAPGSELGEDEDLLHEELHAENTAVTPTIAPMPIDEHEEKPVEKEEGMLFSMAEPLHDDLQPGGVGSGIEDVPAADTSNKASVLDSMTLKELKRLADQRNLHYDSKARKPELIAIIRAAPVTAFAAGETTISLS
jgi:hypothetical protein